MKTYETPEIEKFLGQIDKNEQPKVTIVTITYNLIKAGRSEFFKQCINSIYTQSYKNIEHIIIDGNSNDGTVEMLKKEAPKSTILSEPDDGIYDAFNKGIKKANGKYIAFLNADDYYTSEKSIEWSIKYLSATGADFSYSRSYFVDNNDNIIHTSEVKPELFYAKMPFCHQTMITKKESLLKVGGFDKSFKLSADYDLIVRLILNGATCVEIPHIIANFRYGGLSSSNDKLSRDECEKIIKKHFLDKSDDDVIYNTLCRLYIPKTVFEKLEKSNTDYFLKQKIKDYILKKGVNLGKFIYIREVNFLAKTQKKFKLFFVPFFNIKLRENVKEFYLWNKIKFLQIETTNDKVNYKILNITLFSTRDNDNETSFYLFNIPIFKYYA